MSMNEDSTFRKAKEELKRERDMMQGKSFRQKAGYFFTYYKIPVIIIAVVIAILISILYSRAQHRDYAFHALFVNADNSAHDEQMEAEFGAWIDFDSDKYQVVIDSSMYIDGNSQGSIASTEKLAAEVSSEILDVCIMPEDLFSTYTDEGCFGDLSNYLTEEQLDYYADLLVYDGDTPVGIRADDFAIIKDASLYTSEDAPVFGIVYNAPHSADCSLFLDYLTGR
ncbi:MAG: hypothetical protein LUE92_00325 [Clostridiales bacterium]|nr:hypothetical protein [Clostridiales bacterium]